MEVVAIMATMRHLQFKKKNVSNDEENKNMDVYWADKEKNVSRGRRMKGDVWTRARRKREEACVVGTAL
jgi:hypothetical protein